MYSSDLRKASLLPMLIVRIRRLSLNSMQRELPKELKQFSKADLANNFERVYEEDRSIFNN